MSISDNIGKNDPKFIPINDILVSCICAYSRMILDNISINKKWSGY